MKIISLLLCLLMLVPSPGAAADEPLSIIAVNFPCYDFARVLTQGDAQLRMLLPPGSESHSYEPSPQDIIAIQNCDLFLYTGGESDNWIETILSAMGDEAPAVFRLSDCVTLLESETSASMEHNHTHEHDAECNEPGHAHDSHDHEVDEHVWTSPKNVSLIIDALSDTLSALDPVNAQRYQAAALAYQQELTALDDVFTEIVRTGKRDLIIFGDRFPFRYFASAYNLRYDAAFPGCSEDSEPSVRTVISLVDTVREQNIPVIFYIEFSSRRTADILAEETGAKLLLFHSCHNVSSAEMEAGASYLSLMWQNTQTLKEALN